MVSLMSSGQRPNVVMAVLYYSSIRAIYHVVDQKIINRKVQANNRHVNRRALERDRLGQMRKCNIDIFRAQIV